MEYELTPIEKKGDIYLKRDDLFEVAGVHGGKARTCWEFCKNEKVGLVSAGNRRSPQLLIVSAIAKKLSIPCHLHTAQGSYTEEINTAMMNGALIFQHNPGYNNVIVKRARDDAFATGFTEVPFGMECEQAIHFTRQQVKNIPTDTKRIVMVCASGMSVSGVLWGLKDLGLNIPVLGVMSGANSEKRLDKWAPKDWRETLTLVPSGYEYHESPKVCEFEGVKLDQIYEAKCVQFLQPGDLFWIIGIR